MDDRKILTFRVLSCDWNSLSCALEAPAPGFMPTEVVELVGDRPFPNVRERFAEAQRLDRLFSGRRIVAPVRRDVLTGKLEVREDEIVVKGGA